LNSDFFVNEALIYLRYKWEIDPLLTRIAYKEFTIFGDTIHGTCMLHNIATNLEIPEDKLNRKELIINQYIIPTVHRLITKIEYKLRDFRISMEESKVSMILAPKIMGIEKTLGVTCAIAFDKENNLVLRTRHWYNGNNSSIGVCLDVLCGFKVT